MQAVERIVGCSSAAGHHDLYMAALAHLLARGFCALRQRLGEADIEIAARYSNAISPPLLVRRARIRMAAVVPRSTGRPI